MLTVHMRSMRFNSAASVYSLYCFYRELDTNRIRIHMLAFSIHYLDALLSIFYSSITHCLVKSTDKEAILIHVLYMRKYF